MNLYDYLVDKDFSQGQLRFTPRLAVSWSSDDNIHWTIRLRDDVYWHNGDKFTAQDVKFTIERSQQDKKLISSAKFRRIKTVEAPDDTTLKIETDGPDTLLLHAFVGNGAGILPKAAFEKAGGREEFFKQPVGTGPYLFKRWVKSDRLVLAKNPRWWGGTPKWDDVVIRAIPETSTRVAELLTGGVDIAVNIPPEDIARLNDNKGTRAITFDIARNLALHVRTGKDRVTGDPRVREAIDLAIDRDAIVKQVLEGHGAPTCGFFPPAIPGFAPDLSRAIRFDPERAKALLREAGFTSSKRPAIRISTPSGRYVKDREIVEAVAGYLEDVGSRAQVEVLDWTVYNNKLVGDPAPQLQLSLILGAAFGFVIQRSRFCFLCIWRDWLDRRDPRGLLGIVTALAVGITGYTLIFGAWLPDPSGTRLPPTAHIGPVSLALVLAGLAFGAGMALSGSCLSAHLYRLGEGSPTAPFALIGAVGGFIPGFQSWNGLYLWTIAGAPVPWLPRHLGYGGALIASLAVLAALAWFALRKGRFPQQPEPSRDPLVAIFRQRWPAWLGGLSVGLIGVAAYLRLSPLGVTAEIGSRSRQLAGAFELLPSRLERLDSFRGCATVIRDALLTPNGLFIAGIVAAALIAALAAGEFKPRWPTIGQALRGLTGGVLLGWGTVIGLGCTVGTLLSGISASALSGWVFALALGVGATATLRLGRRAGLPL